MLIAYDCINTVVFVVLAYLFMRVFLGNSSNLKAPIIIAWIILELITVNVFSEVFIVKAAFTVLLTSIASIIIFRAKAIKVLLLSVMEYGLYAAIEVATYFAFLNYTSYVYIYDLDDSIMSVYVGTFSELLFILILLLIRLMFKKKSANKFNSKELAKYAIFPIISLSIIIVVGIYSSISELTANEISIYTYLAIVLLVVNIYLYWLLQIDVNNKLLKEKNDFFEIYANDLTNLYEQIRDEHSEIKSIEHEYKNHLAVIKTLVASGKNEELKAYLSKDNNSTILVDVIDTGNSIVSALFNAKYAEAHRKGIKVRFDIGNLKNVSIRDTDLVIIISNLFNNAIEACEHCDTRIINIKINHNGNMLFISFSNTYDKSQIKEGYLTNKQDKSRHGFGLNNIKAIVESYEGQIDIIPHDDYFSVRIMIFS